MLNHAFNNRWYTLARYLQKHGNTGMEVMNVPKSIPDDILLALTNLTIDSAITSAVSTWL